MANQLLSQKINLIDGSKIEKMMDAKLEKFEAILANQKRLLKPTPTLVSLVLLHQVTLSPS